MNHKEMFEALRAAGQLTVRYKNESSLMKAIGTVMFFNRRFMEMTTTIGTTVYFPSRQHVEQDPWNAWDTLAHEYVHAVDHRNSKLFGVLYLFPQVLALLALLAIPLWSWWPLLCLLFLAPLPAPWRLRAELRGYAMSMAVWYWYRQTGGIPLAMKDKIVGYMTDSTYYFTWPSGAHVRGMVDSWSKRILLDEVTEPEFQLVRDLIKARQTKR